MKLKKLIPVLCLSLGLTLSIPVTTFATETPETPTTETLQNGWSADKNSFIRDGKKVVGIQQINGTFYYFNAEGQLVKGIEKPIQVGGNLYFVKADGSLLRNKWVLFENYWYYAKDSAKLCVNEAHMIGGKIYCFYIDGRKLTNGPKTIGGNVYLLNAKGVAKTGLQKYNGKKYFFKANGAMVTSRTVKQNGNLYYTTRKGFIKTGWFTAGGKTYYAASNGKLKTGWVVKNGKNYYFNKKTGALQAGWQKVDNNYYYYNKKGNLQTGWFTVGTKKYYAPSSGSNRGARLIGFHVIGSKRYLFDGKGVLSIGFKVREGYTYYSDSTGAVATGWKNINNKWYFFESSGVMRTGWLVHNGRFYYMDPKTGAMVQGNKTINGVTYKFNSDGSYSNGTLSGSWSIRVNRAANVVTVYKGTTPVKAFLCSTGLNNATPLGTFSIMDKLSMHELNGPTWGYYCSHITSDILFHSIPAPTTNRTEVPSYKFNVLGQQASQGCIRLAMGDAKWLYDTVPVGTTVVIYDDASNPGPLGKPANIKMNADPTYYIDPTDPIFYPSYSTFK